MNEKLIEIGEFIYKSLLNGSSKTNPAFDEAMLLFVCNSLALLKEQSVKPRRDGRVWLCGNCGEYVGFEDHDENDPNEFDNYCRKCGKAVRWE